VSDGATVLQELARELQGGGSPPAPPSPTPSDGTRTIAVNNTAADCACGQGKGKPCCLDVSNWNKADNAPVLASSCNYPPVGPNGVGNQRWTLESDGTIKVALDGKCLTTASAARPDADNHGKGTAVTVATCKPGDKTQQWSAGVGESGPLKSGGKCLALDKSGARMQCGAGYTLETCDPSNQLQQWTVEAAIAPPAPPAPPKPKLTLLSFAAKQDDKIFGTRQACRHLFPRCLLLIFCSRLGSRFQTISRLCRVWRTPAGEPRQQRPEVRHGIVPRLRQIARRRGLPALGALRIGYQGRQLQARVRTALEQ